MKYVARIIITCWLLADVLTKLVSTGWTIVIISIVGLSLLTLFDDADTKKAIREFERTKRPASRQA